MVSPVRGLSDNSLIKAVLVEEILNSSLCSQLSLGLWPILGPDAIGALDSAGLLLLGELIGDLVVAPQTELLYLLNAIGELFLKLLHVFAGTGFLLCLASRLELRFAIGLFSHWLLGLRWQGLSRVVK